MNIVLEFRQCDDYENVFMCPIYSSQDHVMKKYTEHILSSKVSIYNGHRAEKEGYRRSVAIKRGIYFTGFRLGVD